MATVYSTRFVRTNLSGVLVEYIVPAGRRAVVRCATFVNGGNAVGRFYLTLSGSHYYLRDLQALTSLSADLRVVAYAGEGLGVYTEGEFLTTTVHGYLFNDLTPGADEELEITPGEPAWEPVPALGELGDSDPRRRPERA